MNSMVNESSPVVGIGCSAGGLSVLKVLFENMPSDTGIVFVIVQHLDPTREMMMAELLSRITDMDVFQVVDKVEIKPNTIYIIPPNKSLIIEENRLHISNFKERRGIRMPIDDFFYSLAIAKEERAFAVVLSGSNNDGVMGIKKIKEHGGVVIAQSPETAEYSQMPQNAIMTGFVDYVLDVQNIPSKIIAYLKHNSRVKRIGDDTNIEINTAYDDILSILHKETNNSFLHYRKKTFIRRIERRMSINNINDLKTYSELLKKSNDEVLSLFKDLLIGVTGFFREPEVWQKVKTEVLPKIISELQPGAPLRIWVPGCSTGEEAYTIAMIALEAIEEQKRKNELQIFATDIDAPALEAARAGRYSDVNIKALGEERVDRFFTHIDNEYVAKREIRDTIVFSQQNLIGDPPFSRLNLISCRNLLIYLIPEIQAKVISLFHFALVENGYMVLGSSETLGKKKDLFNVLDKSLRIYKKDSSAKRMPVNFPLISSISTRHSSETLEKLHVPISTFNPFEIVRQSLLEHYAPPSVLINNKHEILYFSGRVEKFLRIAHGKPSLNFFDLLREGSVTRVRNTISKAKQSKEKTVVENARMKRDGNYFNVKFEILPIQEKDLGQDLLLISFFEQDLEDDENRTEENANDDSLIQQLEIELKSTKEDLHAIIEEMETNNEELQSSNEELETSQEELQSLNEELNTYNSQLQETIEELKKINDHLNNLIINTDIATFFINSDGILTHFTPSANRIFNLISSDIGRKMTDISNKIIDFDIRKQIDHVNTTTDSVKEVIKTEDGKYYTCCIRPYKTYDNRLDGVVLTFNDITELRDNQLALESYAKLLNISQEISNLGSWQINLDTGKERYSDNLFHIFEIPESSPFPDHDTFTEKLVHKDDRVKFRQDWEHLLQGDVPIEYRVVTPKGNTKWIHSKGYHWTDNVNNNRIISGFSQDVTEKKNEEERLICINEELQKLNESKNSLFAIISHDLSGPLHNIGGVLEHIINHFDEYEQNILLKRISIAHNTAKSIQKILKQLLQWAKLQMEEHKAFPELLHPDLIKTILDEETAQIEENKNIHFDIQIEKHFNIFVDKNFLQIILRNLIMNAYKFSNEDGKIEVICSNGGNRAKIVVKDYGMGMDNESVQKINNGQKAKVRPGTLNEQGTGLGFMIIRELLFLNNGDLEASSNPGEGTEIQVSFPEKL